MGNRKAPSFAPPPLQFQIALGSRVRDKVTGFTGIATARTEWLNGCARITIQAEKLKDGKPLDGYTVDESQVEVITSFAFLRRATNSGGPRPEPKRQETPTR